MIRILVALLLIAAPLRAATDIVEHTTPKGITFWMVSEPSIPILAIDVNFRGGSALDAPGKEGATYLMMGLLEEGAGDMDAAAFSKAEERLAARFSYDAWRDSVSVSAEMLVENAANTIELLRAALVEPSFTDEAVDRVRDQVLSGIASDQTDPVEIAQTAYRETTFDGHVYARAREGTVETVTGLSPDDIRAAHRASLVREGMTVGVVGAMSPEEVAPLIDRLLADLPSTGPAQPAFFDPITTGGIDVITMDVPQSVAVFGHGSMLRDDPDYLTAYVLMEIFAGTGLGSRLNDEVREKRGLTYGVYASLAPSDRAGQILGQVQSSNDKIGEAIDVIRNEWARIAEAGVTADELEKIKKYLTGSYALRFDSNSKIAGNLAGMQSVGLPIDYVKNRNDLVNAVTLEEANRVAARIFRPEALSFVVVGQPKGLGE